MLAGTSTADAGQLIATEAHYTPIAVAGKTVAWSHYVAGVGYRLRVSVDGRVRTTPIAARTKPFDVSLGARPDGATVAWFSRCAKRCRVAAADITTGEEHLLARGPTSTQDLSPATSGRSVLVAIAAASPRLKLVTVGAPLRAVRTVTVRTNDSSASEAFADSFEEPDLLGSRIAAVHSFDPMFCNQPADKLFTVHESKLIVGTALGVAPVLTGCYPGSAGAPIRFYTPVLTANGVRFVQETLDPDGNRSTLSVREVTRNGPENVVAPDISQPIAIAGRADDLVVESYAAGRVLLQR